MLSSERDFSLTSSFETGFFSFTVSHGNFLMHNSSSILKVYALARLVPGLISGSGLRSPNVIVLSTGNAFIWVF